MPTLATRLAGVPWVNKPDRNTSPSCFVGDKHAKLGESPGLPFIAVFASNRYPLSNACQVFKSQCLARLNSFVYQGFRYSMIGVLLKAVLTSTHLLETAFRRTCTDLLQDLTAVMIGQPNFMNLRPGGGFTPPVGCQVDDTHANNKGFFSFYLFMNPFAP